MAHYIDKETIRAEIRRQLSAHDKVDHLEAQEVGKAWNRGHRKALENLLSFIDTIPEQPVEKTSYDTQKYTPSPSVSIEDVARVQFASHAKLLDKKRKAVFDWEQFKEVVSIFYGFGKNDSPETKEKEQPTKDFCKENCKGFQETGRCFSDEPCVAKQTTSKELEEEIERFYRTDEYRIADTLGRGFETLARHFAEWGAKHLKK